MKWFLYEREENRKGRKLSMNSNYSTEKVAGRRVFLSPITKEDTKMIIEWRNQPEIRNCFLDRRLLTEEMHDRWLKEYVYTGRTHQWIIYEMDTKQPVGCTYLRDIDYTNRKCEFGIYIGELQKTTMGYGSEACAIVTDYAFSKINMAKVFLKVLADNKAAIKTYKNVGYIEEGLFRMDRWINNKPVDVMYMAKYNSNCTLIS